MPEAVDVLLAAGASVSVACGSTGDTVLHAAASPRTWVARHCPQRQLQILQRVTAAPAAASCLNAVNAVGLTPMAQAVCHGRHRWQGARGGNASCLDRVRVLLAAGADVNAAGPGGRSPLVQAVGGCDGNQYGLEVVAALLNAGVDPELLPPLSAAWVAPFGVAVCVNHLCACKQHAAFWHNTANLISLKFKQAKHKQAKQ